MKKLVFTLSFLVCFSISVQAQSGNLNHLKSWAATTPLDFTVRPKRNLYALPELKTKLLDLLGRERYARLVSWSERVTPIDVIDGYLIAKGFSVSGNGGRFIVAIRLYDGAFDVIFWPDDDSPPERYRTKGAIAPKCALEL